MIETQILREHPDPAFKRLDHTWAVDFYVYSVMVTTGVAICCYTATLFRAWFGTRYYFILLLIILLIMSNAGGMFAAYYGHKVTQITSEDIPWTAINRKELEHYADIESIAVLVRDACLNLAIWSFSFRYWNLAHVLPFNLRGQPVSLCSTSSPMVSRLS